MMTLTALNQMILKYLLVWHCHQIIHYFNQHVLNNMKQIMNVKYYETLMMQQYMNQKISNTYTFLNYPCAFITGIYNINIGDDSVF